MHCLLYQKNILGRRTMINSVKSIENELKIMFGDD